MSCSKSSDDNNAFAFTSLLNSYTGSTASVTHQQEIIHSETELQEIAKEWGIENKIAKLPKINFNTEQLVLIWGDIKGSTPSQIEVISAIEYDDYIEIITESKVTGDASALSRPFCIIKTTKTHKKMVIKSNISTSGIIDS
ncbi:hypothetical protein Coch_1213 [Capnocytophaga ochracea DSM 7271]|uniref:Uncharacterized protein n=2 Tax=Capnocytophaga ochracea TaxID=1018 RepID=C7M4X3_CAPOD|nr:hypothetical protein Coch_1213 [Capnocytophaga ochracea DSM 7271]